MPKIKTYLRSFSSYIFFGAMTSIVPVIFMPFLTKNLEAADFGLISSFNIVAMILGNVIRLDLNNGLKRFYAKEKDDFGKFVTGAFFSSLSAFFIVTFLIYFLSLLNIKEILNVPIKWLYYAGLLAFLRSQIMNLHHLWQVTNQPIKYGLWSIIAISFVYLLFSALIIAGEARWQSRVISEVCISIVSFIAAAISLTKKFGFFSKTNLKTIKKLLRFSVPIIPGSFLSYYFITSDRIFISEFFTDSQLGLYSLAFRVSSILDLFFKAVIPVWESWLFKDRGECLSKRLLKIILSLLGVVAVLVVLASLISPYFLRIIANVLVDNKLAGMDQFLFPCTVAILSSGFYRFTVSLSLLISKSKNITYSNIVMLIVNLPLMYIFIRAFEVSGAGVGVAVTFVIGAVFQIFLFVKGYLAVSASARIIK